MSDRVSGVTGALQDEKGPQGEMGKMETMVSLDHLVPLDHRWAQKTYRYYTYYICSR